MAENLVFKVSAWKLLLHVLFPASPKVNQVIPAIETEPQSVALKPQAAQKLPHGSRSNVQYRCLQTSR